MEPAAGAAAKPFGDRIRRHQTQERDREAPVLRGRRLLVASVCQFCGSTALSVLFGGCARLCRAQASAHGRFCICRRPGAQRLRLHAGPCDPEQDSEPNRGPPTCFSGSWQARDP